MRKKILIMGAAALLSANAYAQRPLKMAKNVTEAMTGGVSSAFSSNVPVSVINAQMLGNQVVRAQFAAIPKVYLSSAQLFKQVEQSHGLKNLEPADIKLLEAKFNNLDEVVKLQIAAFTGYRGALLSERPGLPADVLMNAQVNSMLQVLDIQHYIQMHNNEFPQLFTINPSGWLLTTDLWNSREGMEIFRQVLDILIKEQAGQIYQT